MKTLKLISWNVNGLRSIIQKGFFPWLMSELPDIVSLQEIKALESDVVDYAHEWSKIYDAHFFSAVKKGYSGTALFVKKNTFSNISIFRGMGDPRFDSEGRLLIFSSDQIILLNGYYPNGKNDHSRVDEKLEFSRSVLDLALNLHQKFQGQIPVILTGDFNTAHEEIDLARPKDNQNTTGFLPHERKFLTEMIQSGFTDVFRFLYPDLPGQFTWWSYRSNARERNVGWRLDYFFIHQSFAHQIETVIHQKDALGSDHCPVVLCLRLN